MRRASAPLLVLWLSIAAWACAQGAPTEASSPDAVGATPDTGAPIPDAGSTPDKTEASTDQDTGGTPPQGDAGVHDSAPPPDAGSCAKVGASKTCGVSPQCGCAANMTCDLNSSADTVCVGPAGSGQAGNLCVNTGSCGLGLTCLYGGTCHNFCATAGQACSGVNQGKCIQLKDQNDAAVPNALVCEVNCQLHDPNSCGSGAACFPSSNTAQASDCFRAGTGAVNANCTYLNDCAAGLGCIGPQGGQAKCKRWCRVGQNDCGGLSCTALNPALVIAGVQYGSCP